ncbi:hypothetical protein [Bacillus thuringiensis]|uniref:hypothetical protein n=1 Tax=Bacillus thuringiensis TaxID=1428 RepID=UPI003F52516B
MNLSIQDELQPFAEELKRYITPVFLEELAREIGVIKRKRKFSGSDLATLCIWLSDRVTALIRRIITMKSKIYLHILNHAVFHQKLFNFLLFINVGYDTERHAVFTAYKIQIQNLKSFDPFFQKQTFMLIIKLSFLL